MLSLRIEDFKHSVVFFGRRADMHCRRACVKFSAIGKTGTGAFFRFIYFAAVPIALTGKDRRKFMRNSNRMFLFISLFVFVSGCGAMKMFHEQNEGQKEHNPLDFGMKPAQHEKRHINYAPGVKGAKFLELDAHWNDSKELQPIAMVIHGGGWIMGSKDMVFQERITRYFANRGYVVFNVDYRLIPKYSVDDCIRDTFGAIVWAKKHAKEFGADPTRVGAMGFSAGGHLAAMAATAGNRMDIFPPTGNTGGEYDASVNVAADFYGAYDMLTMPSDIFPIPKWMNKTFIKFVFEGDPEKNKAYGKKISPINYISDKTPPQLVVCGDADSLKLYPQSVVYVDALKKAGRPVEFITVKGADHSFNGKYWTEESQMAHKAILDYFDKYLKAPSSE